MPLTDRPLDAAPADDSLVRARCGELAAFGELLDEHEARVFSVALRFTGRRADAEELTQDVFVPEARAVLLLRFQEDLDPTGIASVLEMSVNTVKSHLRRSLEWLRAQCAGDHHGY